MSTQITKVKNGTITLPKKFRKNWKGQSFYYWRKRHVLIKRLTKPALTFKEMMDEFYQAACKSRLSKKDVEEAIQSVRREVYR